MSILGFPKEIQGEIFTHAHRDNSNDEALLLPVEVILSHVCSEWRDISINLPILWTAFKFDCCRRASAPVDKLEEYLFRSKTQLLELYFDIFTTGCREADQRFKLVKIAIAHVCRWRRFTLLVDSIYPPIEVLESLKQLVVDAPHLEYFAMCLASTSVDGIRNEEHEIINPKDISPSVFIGGAPKLSVVRIDTMSHFYSLPPLSNITTLTIQDSENREFLYSFRTLRSILMIPALTNLSIESSMNLDTFDIDPETLPRIIMPSLKTLRIAQGYYIVGILSLIDAPLLETLVLYDLCLISLLISQDINKMTAFKNLDTIALLGCRCDLSRGAYFNDPLEGVDAILYELACCATHVIMSSSDDSPESLFKKGSNLFPFEKYKWPRLQCITLDMSTFSGLMNCVKNLEWSPHPLTVRVVEPMLEHWREVQGDSLTRFEKVCKLETMKVGDTMMDEYWPAPGGLFHEDGNLDVIDWGESIRARGLLERRASQELWITELGR